MQWQKQGNNSLQTSSSKEKYLVKEGSGAQKPVWALNFYKAIPSSSCSQKQQHVA